MSPSSAYTCQHEGLHSMERWAGGLDPLRWDGIWRSCNPDYITPVLNVMRNCGLEESAQGIINRCGVNRYGRFCFETERNVSFVLRQIQTSCFSNAETCPIFCRATLELFRTRAGCCLNNLYNNTSPVLVRISDYLTTNHILWSSCGVESPGFCRNTIDNSQLQVSMNVTQSSYSVILQVSMTITGLCTILAMLVWSDIPSRQSGSF